MRGRAGQCERQAARWVDLVAVIGIAVAQNRTQECVDFIASLREGLDASVVMHFLDRHPDPAAFAAALSRRTPFSVTSVDRPQPLRGGCVYLPADGRTLATRADGWVVTGTPGASSAVSFFSSLPRTSPRDAVAVLFADGRHDDVPGLDTILEDGGITVFALSPSVARQQPAALAGRVDAFLRKTDTAPTPAEVRERVFARYRQITAACGDAPSLDQALARVLALLAAGHCGCHGRVYLTGADDPSVLAPGTDLWCVAGPEDDAEQVAVDRETEQFLRHAAREAMRSAATVSRRLGAQEARFPSGAHAVAVPMVCAGEVVGALASVLNGCGPEGPSTGLIEAAAGQLAQRVLAARLEERAAESRNLMLRLSDNVPYLLFVYDLQTDRVTYANRRTREQLGYESAAFDTLGRKKLATLVHPGDLAAVRHDLRMLRCGLAEPEAEVELRVLHASGQWRWLHLRRATFSTGPNGRPRAILISGVDVTASKTAHQALNESENRFQAVFHNAALGVVLLDTQGRLELVNRAFRQFVGFSGDELYKRSLRDLTHPADAARDQHLFDELLAGQRHACTVETRYIRNGGAVVWGHLSASVLRDGDGRPISVICVVKDISQRKRIEKAFVDFTVLEQRKVLQYLHDNLGQQLTGLQMAAQNLRQSLHRRQAPETAAAGELILWLTEAHNQLRALSAGLRPVEVDAEGFCIAARDLAANTESVTGIRCRVQCDTDFVLSDDNTAAHLFYIVQEAVSNAVQHSGATAITIGLDSGDGQVMVTVEDNGRGLPDDVMAMEGTGIRIMAYRAGIIGAALTLQAGAQRGTVMTCALREDKQ